MSIRLIAGIILFCLFLGAIFLVNTFSARMIGEINRKRQEGNQIANLGFTLPKSLRILDEYRHLYPDGKLHIYALAAFGIQMLCLVLLCVVFLSMSQ